MTSIIETINHWDYRFLPPFTLVSPDYRRALAYAAIIAAVVTLSILITWLIGLMKPGKLILYGHRVYSISAFVVVVLAVFTSALSRNLPFAPVYIAAGLLMYCLGLLALGTNYWIILRKCGGLAGPYFLHLRSLLWLNLVMSSYIFIPPLVFQMPSFNRAGQTFFWGIPVVMIAAYAAWVRLVMPNALALLGLHLREDDLTGRQKEILGGFMKGDGKKDYEIVVARQGLLNAIAYFLKKQKIIIGVDLLDNLEEDEVKAILLHEEGHLQDQVLRKATGRLTLSIPLLVFLFSVYYATDLPGRGLPLFLAALAAYFVFARRLRKVRLMGELTADVYVRARGEEIYESQLSGIEKLNKLAGIDRDICKRNNLGHLDLDERRDLTAGGRTEIPQRLARRRTFSFALWLVVGVMIGLGMNYLPLTPSSRWREAHSEFHDLMYSESGDAAVDAIRKAVVIAEKNFGTPSKKLYTSLADLTEALSFYDNYEDAIKIGTRAVQVGERLYGQGDLKIVRSLKNMGEIHYWNEEYTTSRGWFERTLKLQKMLGDDDSNIIDTLEWLSWTWEEEQRYEEAVDLHKEILRFYGRDGENRHDAVKAVIRMASFLGLLGKKEDADRLHSEGLSTAEANFGSESETYAEIVLDISYSLCGRGDQEAAGQYLAQGLDVLDALSEKSYLSADSALQQMAVCYRKAGHGEGIIAAYEEILERRVKSKGALDIEDIGALWALAEAHESHGSPYKAGEYYMLVAEMEEQSDGIDIERLKRTYSKIIEVMTGQGNQEKANEYIVRGKNITGWVE